MRTALTRHTLPFALLAALLGCSAALAAPALAMPVGTAGGSSSSGTSTTPATAPAGAEATSGGSAPITNKTNKPALATWFGPGFYGHMTACGQTMSPKLVGVANRTLPCGTLVQIDYRGRKLTAPVVDRGPYGRIGAMWDLTAGAARALKVKETVRITTAIVGSLPNTPTLGEPEAEPEPSLEAGATPATTGTAPAASIAATGGAAVAD